MNDDYSIFSLGLAEFTYNWISPIQTPLARLRGYEECIVRIQFVAFLLQL